MINIITQLQATFLLENYQSQTVGDVLQGKFIQPVSTNSFVAIDNIDGDAFTEEFKTLSQAVNWLNGKFEIDEYLSGMVDEQGEIIEVQEQQACIVFRLIER
ncbi:hypothetical protein DT351_11045 (plasmid) [Latilactobacillus curvatus]|uniref:Uncharacterized protein n=1 Tax=Latilactobacillus curvatus TaxID=28038 RepID=A0A385AH21_LATCU|nr:hypothetical protein [Latilactobacillus curvatus]AXN36877.1 hypothetical protein DT351_11045 [Latilactobacillus curvatus]